MTRCYACLVTGVLLGLLSVGRIRLPMPERPAEVVSGVLLSFFPVNR